MNEYYFEETVVKYYCVPAESEFDARAMCDYTHLYEEKTFDFELVDVCEGGDE